MSLYDKNGEYIGWKEGKPYWANHGPHHPVFINLEDKKTVICQDCLTDISIGEYKGIPKESNINALGKVTGQRITYLFRGGDIEIIKTL